MLKHQIHNINMNQFVETIHTVIQSILPIPVKQNYIIFFSSPKNIDSFIPLKYGRQKFTEENKPVFNHTHKANFSFGDDVHNED